MRYSHQRELILREVLSRTDHPTAEQICTSLRVDCPRLSLGTVYRDLNTLVEIGKIRRVSIPGEADRFDGETTVHQHLWCRKCHSVQSLPSRKRRSRRWWMPARTSRQRITPSPSLACAASALPKRRTARAENKLSSFFTFAFIESRPGA